MSAYAAAALLGYELAVHGLLPFAPFRARTTSTPLARLGLALTNPRVETTGADWAAFEQDLESFRVSSHLARPDVVDLVVALRGLNVHGSTDWAEAGRLCKTLEWQRCDRPALEAMKKRSVP